MKTKLILLIFSLFVLMACNKDEETSENQGCTDASACNYDSSATENDGSCSFVGDPCDDGDPETIDDVYNSDCFCEGQPQGEFIKANVSSVEIIAENPCPSSSINPCNTYVVSENTIYLEWSVSEEDETGWEIRFENIDLDELELPFTFETPLQDQNNPSITFYFYDGLWVGDQQYAYVSEDQNEEGDLEFTITSKEDDILIGTFSGEIYKWGSTDESFNMTEGSFRILLEREL